MVCDSIWFFWTLLVALAWGAWRRAVSREEWIAFGVLAANFLLIQLQMPDGFAFPRPNIDWRYQMPGLGLAILLLVGNLVRLVRCERSRLVRWIAVLLVVAVAIRPTYKSVKRLHAWRPLLTAISQADAWATDFIRNDWKGPARGDYCYCPSEYRSNRLPTIVDHFGFVPLAVGGRSALVALETFGVKDFQALEVPDYVILSKASGQSFIGWYLAQGGVVVAERAFCGIPFVLLKHPFQGEAHARAQSP